MLLLSLLNEMQSLGWDCYNLVVDFLFPMEPDKHRVFKRVFVLAR